LSKNVADRLRRSARGRGRRARRVGQVGSERRLLWIVAVYLLVIGTILGYNAIATAGERDAALSSTSLLVSEPLPSDTSRMCC